MLNLVAGQPYVGPSAFAHKGGVHGAAVAKVERSYQHVEPSSVGNTGRLVVSELGGRAELSAFFLEDLLLPRSDEGTSAPAGAEDAPSPKS